MRISNLVNIGLVALGWFVLSALPIGNTASAQDSRIGDTAAVQMSLYSVQQSVQLGKAEYEHWAFNRDLIIDGEMMADSTIRAELRAIYELAETRLKYRPDRLFHPLDEFFGPFGEFQVEDCDYSFEGDTCTVNLTFALYRYQASSVAGMMKFHRMRPYFWVLDRIDGLLPFLEANATVKRPPGYLEPPQKP